MRIEINPHSLLNLEQICEVLHNLHPLVLNKLVEIKRSFGDALGKIDLNNLSQKEREFLSYLTHPDEEEKDNTDFIERLDEETGDKSKLLRKINLLEEEINSIKFYNLKKYLKLVTYEYIPIKIYVEVEDPVIGRKVKELVEEVERTIAPEQYFFLKRETDEDAYFAEGYGVSMNEEQKKKLNDFLAKEDCKELKKILLKNKSYSLVKRKNYEDGFRRSCNF